MNCSNCGSILKSSTSKFCGMCGTMQSEDTAQATQAQQAAQTQQITPPPMSPSPQPIVPQPTAAASPQSAPLGYNPSTPQQATYRHEPTPQQATHRHESPSPQPITPRHESSTPQPIAPRYESTTPQPTPHRYEAPTPQPTGYTQQQAQPSQQSQYGASQHMQQSPQYSQPTPRPPQPNQPPQYGQPPSQPPQYGQSGPQYTPPQQPQPMYPQAQPTYPQAQPPYPQPGYYPPPSPPPRRGVRTLLIVLSTVGVLFILLIVIGIIWGDDPDTPPYVPAIVGTTDQDNVTPTPPVESQVLTGAQIFAKNRDAVIIIRTTDQWGHYIGTGSGFIVCSTGIAVTNHHVMVDWTSAVAILYDGREFDITGYYSYDFDNDLAVIQVDGRGAVFDYVTLGNSDQVSVGENVFAIGGPDWDPITFTPGMVSRIVYEHIPFGVYSISGMFQSTAAIYGGNSGGPLVNDRGQVIGVNAAGNTARASVQFAVPANRIAMPQAGSTVNPLPMGGTPTAPAHTGEIFAFDRFHFIPDFLSVSRNASLLFGGTPANLGLVPGDIIYDLYDYLYMYDLQANRWIADTDEYDIILMDHGFIFQNIVHHDTDVWVYFFHPDQNISLSYAFMTDSDILLIAIVTGDVYTAFYHGGEVAEAPQHIPSQPSSGLTIAAIWRFVESTDDFYTGLMNNNEDVFYAFEYDGTGIWGSVNAQGVTTHELTLTWHSNNGVITIDFPAIDLQLIYDYYVEHDNEGYYLLLFGPAGAQHYLHLVERW